MTIKLNLGSELSGTSTSSKTELGLTDSQMDYAVCVLDLQVRHGSMHSSYIQMQLSRSKTI